MKKFSLVIMALVAALVLAGCKSTGNQDAVQESLTLTVQNPTQ